MFKKADLKEVANIFTLKKVANYPKIKMIKDEGVKQIKLNAVAYDMAMKHEERKNPKKALLGGVVETLQSLVYTDSAVDFETLHKTENLNVSLSIKMNTRKKGGDIGTAIIENIANQLIDQEEDGYIIETLKGKTIKPEELSISKKIRLPSKGKSFVIDSAWLSLTDYFDALKSEGYINHGQQTN